MRYFLIAGEASGDLHASELIRQLRLKDATAEFTFLGGDKMAGAAGTAPLIHYRDMAYMGFAEVLRHLPRIRRNMRIARQSVLETRPDALILIDYPGFNLKVAKTASKAGIPVYYYIPPKIWAWKKWRIKDIRKYVRRVLAILPFEPEFYRRNGSCATYVGNPSVEEIDRRLAATSTREDFLKRHRLRDRPLIALMPGSRVGEIRNNLPVMTAALRRFPQYRGVIIGAPSIDDGIYDLFHGDVPGDKVPVVREASATDVLVHCRGALVTSGTATLETALSGVPQVALYRGSGSRIAYEVMKRILSVRFVTLPNLIAGRAIIPELLMHECTAENAAAALSGLLKGNSPARDAQTGGYAGMRKALGTQHAAATAAEIIYSELKQ